MQPTDETLFAIEALDAAAYARWLTLFDAECAAYYALLDLAHADIMSGPVWDAAANAHYRATQALEQHCRRMDAISTAWIQAVVECARAQ
jgi:hypothetical protein